MLKNVATIADLLAFDVYLPISNRTRIQIICHVDTLFTPWQKERTLEGLQDGRFAYKGKEVYQEKDQVSNYHTQQNQTEFEIQLAFRFSLTEFMPCTL